MREITQEDIPVLVTLISQLGYVSSEAELAQCLSAYLADQDSWAYGIECEGVLVAAASYHRVPYFHRPGGLLRVTSLVVDQAHRRSGLGRQLIDKADELAAASGCDRIELASAAHRAGEAHRFYENNGFVPYDGVRYLREVAPAGTPPRRVPAE